MNKANRYLEFIALVVLIGLVLAGCLSGPASLTDRDTMPPGADGSSPSARAGGGSSSARGGGSLSAAQSGGNLSSAQSGVIHRLGAAVQKTWSKFVGFLGKNWLFLLIILIICTVCTIICRIIKRKTKKAPLKRFLLMTPVILTSLGLSFGVFYFGIMGHDRNVQTLKWEQFSKRVPFKNKEAKKKHAYINTNRLNVRSGPSLSHKIIRGLPRNTRLEVLDDSGTWWKVKYENIEGYANSKYLRRE